MDALGVALAHLRNNQAVTKLN